MSKIGLIDVDGHHFPNLALMRISAYHKSIGDEVEWWWSDLTHYDIVYKSKVFSDTYSSDAPDPLNADLIIKGGTGYAIQTINGVEVFDKEAPVLPPYAETMTPDYTVYPQYDFAVSMTTRGCPNSCGFCHVCAKEGRVSEKVADVRDFWTGQREIKVLDGNITACRDKRELFRQYKETGAVINFSQGLDIRLTDDDDIADLKTMRLKQLHFAWDDPDTDLEPYFVRFKEKFGKAQPGMVYVLTNYGNREGHVEEALYRIEILRALGYDPYLMIYDKTSAPTELRRMQRWCNNKFIFKSCTFDEYQKKEDDRSFPILQYEQENEAE